MLVSSVAAVSLIDLFQIVRQHSVVGDSPHQRESLVAASSHEMDVVLEVAQAMPLWNLVYVLGHLQKVERGTCKLGRFFLGG